MLLASRPTDPPVSCLYPDQLIAGYCICSHYLWSAHVQLRPASVKPSRGRDFSECKAGLADATLREPRVLEYAPVIPKAVNHHGYSAAGSGSGMMSRHEVPWWY